MEPDGRIDDGRARKMIMEHLDISSATVLQSYGKAERNRALRKLKNIGLSVRQIERLTGISRMTLPDFLSVVVLLRRLL